MRQLFDKPTPTNGNLASLSISSSRREALGKFSRYLSVGIMVIKPGLSWKSTDLSDKTLS